MPFLRVFVMAGLEFEQVNYDVAVRPVSHYDTGCSRHISVPSGIFFIYARACVCVCVCV